MAKHDDKAEAEHPVFDLEADLRVVREAVTVIVQGFERELRRTIGRAS